MAKTKSRQAAPRRTPPPRQGRRDQEQGRLGWQIWATIGLVILVMVIVGWNIAGSGQDSIEERAAELRAEEAVRDREQIEELTAQARDIRDEIVPALDEMNAALPPGEDSPGPQADPETVDEWREIMARNAALFENPPSGATGTNIARNSIGIAVGLLESAADLYGIALEVDGAQQEDLFARAAEQRNLAVRTWSVGATQLDAINIDAGFGHQHVYLEVEGTGALTPDGAAEGDEATGD